MGPGPGSWAQKIALPGLGPMARALRDRAIFWSKGPGPGPMGLGPDTFPDTFRYFPDTFRIPGVVGAYVGFPDTSGYVPDTSLLAAPGEGLLAAPGEA